MPPAGNTVLLINPQEPSWMEDIHGFLKESILPEDDAAVERIAR
jgi:hypothetical protein